MQNKRYVSKFIYLIFGMIFVCAFFLVPTMLRARVSSTLAKYRALIKLQTIPMPDELHEIYSYSAIEVNRTSCYLGEAYLLVGTDFEVNDILGFYEDYFARQRWSIKANSDSIFYFSATSKQKADAGRAVEGTTVQRCDEECLLGYEFPEDALQETKKYQYIDVIHAWFIPYEIRGNLCWCCSGG